uniref:PSI domain-containing protein n=1 Tax=Branchiostoma floridae TaxID=7739 RepID=C3ZQG4_BRAFL|eukprot:XP_002589209.1 hypothetical protein BRAFLDRAFT_74632 [Branchiostoma floridae]
MSTGKVSILLVSTLAVVLGLIGGQSVSVLSTSAPVTTENASTPTSENSTTVQPLYTLRDGPDCSQYNSCGECIEKWQCYYCYHDNACRLYPARDVLPLHECPLAESRWLISCTFSFLAIVLIAAVIVGVLLLGLFCCCCYCCCPCCCCKRSNRRVSHGGNQKHSYPVQLRDYAFETACYLARF